MAYREQLGYAVMRERQADPHAFQKIVSGS